MNRQKYLQAKEVLKNLQKNEELAKELTEYVNYINETLKEYTEKLEVSKNISDTELLLELQNTKGYWVMEDTTTEVVERLLQEHLSFLNTNELVICEDTYSLILGLSSYYSKKPIFLIQVDIEDFNIKSLLINYNALKQSEDLVNNLSIEQLQEAKEIFSDTEITNYLIETRLREI